MKYSTWRLWNWLCMACTCTSNSTILTRAENLIRNKNWDLREVLINGLEKILSSNIPPKRNLINVNDILENNYESYNHSEGTVLKTFKGGSSYQ
jgi:hypothetical protein